MPAHWKAQTISADICISIGSYDMDLLIQRLCISTEISIWLHITGRQPKNWLDSIEEYSLSHVFKDLTVQFLFNHDAWSQML